MLMAVWSTHSVALRILIFIQYAFSGLHKSSPIMTITSNVRACMDTVTGQILALAKELDAKNLASGYNLESLFVIGTNGELWQFYTSDNLYLRRCFTLLVTTSEKGWTVHSSELMFWKHLGSTIDESAIKILGMLNG